MRSLLSLLCLWLAFGAPIAVAGQTYRIDYEITLEAGEPWAAVSIRVDSGAALKRLDFRIKPERHRDFRGDGEIRVDGNRVAWSIPRRGGTLRYRVQVPNQRRGDGYDALITDHFALFRGDDLIPPASARAQKGAQSIARLRFRLPPRWSVQTGWLRERDRVSFRIDNPERRFDRPTGWMLAGRIGVRTDRIGRTKLTVAGPEGSGLRRMDVLTFMNFIWPELDAAFGVVPPKVLLVGAGDPMWRGGLSAPNSIFLHADRPIVSENGTSTLVHELFHLVTRIRGADRDDWIAEGLAEFYAVELMRRAGGLSDARHDKVRGWLEDFGREVRTLKGDRASGPTMARAAILFWDLDREIRVATGGQRTLDDVVRDLIPIREVSEADLRRIATRIAGRPPMTLDTPLLR